MTKGLSKVLALTLVLVLVFVVSVGCRRTPVDTPTTTTTAQATTTAAETEPAPITYDFGGRPVRWAAWWDGEPSEGWANGERYIERRAELEEKFNVQMGWLNIPWGEVVETLTASVLAGDPFAEIVVVESNWFYPGLVDRGFLHQLDTIEAFDMTEEKWNEFTMESSTFNGHVYGMNFGRTWPRSVFFWNKAIFEREGLPELYDMVDAKQWTWEKLLEFALLTTKDTNGDGVIDQWGLGAQNTLWSFIYSNGAEALHIVDGKPQLGLLDPAAIEAMEFVQELIHVHRVYDLPPEGAPWDYAAQQFQDGRTAMYAFSLWITDRLSENMADDYGMTHFPMGPRTNEYVSFAYVLNMDVMPAGIRDIEEVAMVWNAWTEPYPEDLDDPDAWRAGYGQRVRDSRSLDTLEYMWDNNIMKLSLFGSFQSAVELWWGVEWEIMHAVATPAQVLEGKADAIQQAMLDALE